MKKISFLLKQKWKEKKKGGEREEITLRVSFFLKPSLETNKG